LTHVVAALDIFGFIIGGTAARLTSSQGEGCLLNVMLGIAGAFLGGYVYSATGGPSIISFNGYSAVIAVVGAIVVVALYHAVMGTRKKR
jgi:uncharacterized membrane protein YeaQ/YmgE (transglycosylase-associated protein family)